MTKVTCGLTVCLQIRPQRSIMSKSMPLQVAALKLNYYQRREAERNDAQDKYEVEYQENQIRSVNTYSKLTSKSKASKSMGIVYFRAKFCITPVRNACVKKKPETQNTLGLSFSNQFCKQTHSIRPRTFSAHCKLCNTQLRTSKQKC